MQQDNCAKLERLLFLKHGWGRAAIQLIPWIESAQETIRKEHGSWAILVSDNPLARQYQRLEFRKLRIHRALGLYGMVSCWQNGRVWTAEEIERSNALAFSKYRIRAHAGRHLRNPFEEAEELAAKHNTEEYEYDPPLG